MKELIKTLKNTKELQEVGKNGQRSIVESRQKKIWHIDEIIKVINKLK